MISRNKNRFLIILLNIFLKLAVNLPNNICANLSSNLSSNLNSRNSLDNLQSLDVQNYEILERSNFYKNLPVLVTGGAGFIGSHLVDSLVKLGAKVTVLDNLSAGGLNNLSYVKDKIEFIKGDIEDFKTCLDASKNKKVIFHLAAFVSVPKSVDVPDKCHATNTYGTSNLLEAARQNNVPNFIFSSTCAVYGDKDVKFVETLSCSPESPYGYSKLISELFCQEYSKLYKINAVSLRYFNVYGLRQEESFVVPKFRKNYSNNLPIVIFGDGNQTRDFVPVEYVVEANLICGACAHKISGEVYNIASTRSKSVLELAKELKEEFPESTSKIQFMPERKGDVSHTRADCTKYAEFLRQFPKFLDSKK